MKNIILCIIILFNLNFLLKAQSPWTPVTITSGFVDKNPTFSSRNNYNNEHYSYEFMTFERHNGSTSQICILRMGYDSPIGNVISLTSNPSLKRNPAIAYALTNYMSNLNFALVIWETNQNGKWDLYASSYDTLSGWSSPYAFDTSNGDKHYPKIINYSDSIFSVVYEKNGDIIFRQCNSLSKIVLYDTNITINETLPCSKPDLLFSYNSNYLHIVVYEKPKSNGEHAIYYTRKEINTNWSTPDTLAYLGNNRINSFVSSSLSLIGCTFESDRTGNYKLYVTHFSSPDQQNLLYNYQLDNASYQHFRSSNTGSLGDGFVWTDFYTYLKKTDSTKLICGFIIDSSAFFTDSLTLGDTITLFNPEINNGIMLGLSIGTWVVYTKDSLSYSNIYARWTQRTEAGIKKINSEIPNTISLYQNYPNPFNPITNIRFDIPHSSHIKLIIYDALGREVATLVNEKLSAGSYEFKFNRSDLPSGAYFCRLITEDFMATKKLILIK